MKAWILPLAGAALFSQGLMAHGPDAVENLPEGMVQSRLTQTPSIDGLQVLLLEGPSQGMMVMYQKPEPLTLHGGDEEPFLRFSQEGVQANLASSTWQALKETGGDEATKEPAVAWTPVSDSGRYAWMDPRLSDAPTPSDKSRRQVLSHWEMVITRHGEEFRLRGEHYWQPIEQPATPAQSDHHSH